MLIGVFIRNEQDVGFGGVCDTADVEAATPEQVRRLVADGLANLRAQVLAGRADHLWPLGPEPGDSLWVPDS